jgi:hypothetical protein
MTRRRLLAPGLISSFAVTATVADISGSRITGTVFAGAAVLCALAAIRAIERINRDERDEQRAAIGEPESP